MDRRSFLTHSVIISAGVLLPWQAAAAESELIYVSPLQSNGTLSQCQAEVWYAQSGADMFVVTAHDAWRARAVANGLQRAQIWVGDVGPWQRSGGSYQSLPSTKAVAALVDDVAEHARVLSLFGRKYQAEWGTWGPRFRAGLADGSRVLLKYTPA